MIDPKANLNWFWAHTLSIYRIRQALIEAQPYFKGRLLDLGCGMKPYQAMLGSSVTDWLGIDYPDTASGHSKADVYSSALTLPFGDEVFDTVLCTEVLEHVTRPWQLLAEASRVLKPGGYLILTTPFVSKLHEEPHDYYRFTPYGLQFLARDSGLLPVKTQPLGGFFSTLAYLICTHLGSLTSHRLLRPIGLGLTAGLQLGALRLEKKLTNPKVSPGNLLIALKPTSLA